MEYAVAPGAVTAVMQASRVEIQCPALTSVKWGMGVPKQGNIDLALKFLLDQPECLIGSSPPVDETDLEALYFKGSFDREAAADVGHIAIAADGLEATKALQMLYHLKRDYIAEMQNNILPADSSDKSLREDMAFGQVSIRDNPDHRLGP